MSVSLNTQCIYPQLYANKSVGFKGNETERSKIEECAINPGDTKSIYDINVSSEAKEELANVVDRINVSEKYKRIDQSIPELPIVLMTGDSKTILQATKGIASETKLPIFRLDLRACASKYIHQGAQNIIKAFEQVEKISKETGKPCILLIEDIDQIVGKGNKYTHIDPETTHTTQFMMQDAARRGIVVVGGSDSQQLLDESILRRFNAKIDVGNPDGIKKIYY